MDTFNPLIRHALHFALKYHAGQKRKYRDAPYVAHPIQVALILTRYDRPDDEVIAGILHDVVEDCVDTNAEADEMLAGIRQRFGDAVAAMVAGVTEPKRDAHDRKLKKSEQRAGYLEGLETAPVGSLWVCAADKIQNGNELAVDLQDAEDPTEVWKNYSETPAQHVDWYRRVHTKLANLGFEAPIMDELDRTATRLQRSVAA